MPPSIVNALITPVVWAFQASYPDVRVHMTVSDRTVSLATSDFDLLVQISGIPSF